MKPVRLYILLVLLTSLLLSFIEFHFEVAYINTIFAISPALLALLISAFDRSRSLRDLGWRPAFLYRVKISVLILSVVLLLLTTAWLFGHTEINHRSVKKFFRSETIYLLFLGILINTGEEAGWRGYLFPSLLREQGWWKAIALSTLIWWLWHVPFMAVIQMKMLGEIQVASQLLQLLSLLPVSVIFALWMKESNSFWAIGFAHQLINFCNKWFLGLEHSTKIPIFFKDKSYVSYYSTENGIIGISVMSLTAALLYIRCKSKESNRVFDLRAR